MAFESIGSSVIEVGKALKKSLFNLIKDNFDDHESRLNNIELGAGKVVVANFSVVGYISHYAASELVDLCTFRAPSDFNLLELVITITDSPNGFNSVGVPVTTSTSGTLELDLKKSIDGGITYSSILTTKPKINDGYNGAGTSSNGVGGTAVVFTDVAIKQDDLLRIDVTSLKDTQGCFNISCYGSLD